MTDYLDKARQANSLLDVIYHSQAQAEQDRLPQDQIDAYIDRHIAAWLEAHHPEDWHIPTPQTPDPTPT
jgi:hypothetical protein